jgi:hypothetical protein
MLEMEITVVIKVLVEATKLVDIEVNDELEPSMVVEAISEDLAGDLVVEIPVVDVLTCAAFVLLLEVELVEKLEREIGADGVV